VPVTILSTNDVLTETEGSYVVRLLKELRYQARLREVTGRQWFNVASNAPGTIQMGLGTGFGPDFPAPSTFILPLLSCRWPNSSNYARFCDPHLDKLASRAQAAQLTSPAAARKLWAQADRLATDQAPLVPIYDVTSAGFVSARAGNYQASSEYGPLLDQMWVR
jgi:peptide/nickel transport system substrate-binding protein